MLPDMHNPTAERTADSGTDTVAYSVPEPVAHHQWCFVAVAHRSAKPLDHH
jgi:hypothetical protein